MCLFGIMFLLSLLIFVWTFAQFSFCQIFIYIYIYIYIYINLYIYIYIYIYIYNILNSFRNLRLFVPNILRSSLSETRFLLYTQTTQNTLHIQSLTYMNTQAHANICTNENTKKTGTKFFFSISFFRN